MPESKFYFNPNEKGLSVFLGSTEAKLMEIAWEHREISVKTALFYFDKSNKPAYTTIMTILSRLADKKILERKKVGKSFIYTPAMTKEQFLKKRISLIKSALKQFT